MSSEVDARKLSGVIRITGDEGRVVSFEAGQSVLINVKARVLVIDGEECFVIKREPMHLLGGHFKWEPGAEIPVFDLDSLVASGFTEEVKESLA